MTRLEAIDALLEKVRAGEWCGLAAIRIWPQGRIVNNEWLDEFSLAQRSFNGSTDAAIALIEAVLPGWEYGMNFDAHHEKYAFVQDGVDYETDECYAETHARALLIAILEALKAQEEE